MAIGQGYLASVGGWRPKFERAYQHLEDLNAHITRWLEERHYTIRHQQDANAPERFTVFVSAQRVGIGLSLLVGDFVQNARGSLDHLVFALAGKFSGSPLPDDIAHDSQFPIFGDEDRKRRRGVGPQRFRDHGLSMIRGVDPSAHAVIESVQPYKRGDDFRSHPLWVLHELSNLDKHRLVLLTACHSSGVAFDPFKLVNASILQRDMTVSYGFLEHETEIVTYFAVPIDSSKKMHVEFQPVIDVAFRCGSVADGKGVLVTLSEVLAYIRHSVVDPLTPFL